MRLPQDFHYYAFWTTLFLMYLAFWGGVVCLLFWWLWLWKMKS